MSGIDEFVLYKVSAYLAPHTLTSDGGRQTWLGGYPLAAHLVKDISEATLLLCLLSAAALVGQVARRARLSFETLSKGVAYGTATAVLLWVMTAAAVAAERPLRNRLGPPRKWIRDDVPVRWIACSTDGNPERSRHDLDCRRSVGWTIGESRSKSRFLGILPLKRWTAVTGWKRGYTSLIFQAGELLTEARALNRPPSPELNWGQLHRSLTLSRTDHWTATRRPTSVVALVVPPRHQPTPCESHRRSTERLQYSSSSYVTGSVLVCT